MNPNGPELQYRGPIHNTFLMSFDGELPFFARFAPFFGPVSRCKRPNDPLCLCDNLLSLFSSHRFAFCLPHSPVWGQTGKKPIHDSLPGVKPNKLKSSTPIFYDGDQNCHNLVNCCQRNKNGGLNISKQKKVAEGSDQSFVFIFNTSFLHMIIITICLKHKVGPNYNWLSPQTMVSYHGALCSVVPL